MLVGAFRLAVNKIQNNWNIDVNKLNYLRQCFFLSCSILCFFEPKYQIRQEETQSASPHAKSVHSIPEPTWKMTSNRSYSVSIFLLAALPRAAQSLLKKRINDFYRCIHPYLTKLLSEQDIVLTSPRSGFDRMWALCSVLAVKRGMPLGSVA